MTKSKKEQPYFKVDPTYFETVGLDFTSFMRSRMCGESSCPCYKKESGKKSAKAEKITPKDTIELVAKNCSKNASYFKPHMPVLEVVFRFIVSKNNASISLSDIVKQLDLVWEDYLYLKNRNPSVVERILSGHNDYGIVRVKN